MKQDLQDSSKRDYVHKASCGYPTVLQLRQAYCLAFPEECICPPNIEYMRTVLGMQGQPRPEREQQTCIHECHWSEGEQQQLPLLQGVPAYHCRILELGRGLLPASRTPAQRWNLSMIPDESELK